MSDTTFRGKVVMLLPEFHPVVGGAEIQAKGLSQALRAQGAEVSVLTRRSLPGTPLRESLDGLEVTRVDYPRLRVLGGLCLNLGLAWSLLRHCGPVRVVHFHMTGMHMVLPFLLAKLLGRRVVIKIAGTTEMVSGALARSGLKGRLLRPLLRQSDAVIALNGAIRARLLEIGVDPGCIFMLPNGVDTGKFAAAQARDPLSALFIGRLVPEKGVSYLLQALSLLRERGIALRLQIVGGGALAGELGELCGRLGLADQVRFTGPLQEVTGCYRGAGLFVLPSLSEGLPNALLEAMSCGLPVVATRVGGIPDLVQDGVHGLLVEPGDAGQLADAIERMVGEGELRETMARQGQAAVRASYGMEQIAGCYLRLYQTICSDRSRRAAVAGPGPGQEMPDA